MFNYMVMVDMLIIECIYEFLLFVGSLLCSLKVVFDGKCVIYLQGKQFDYECLDLWEYNIVLGELCLLFDFDELLLGEEILLDEEKVCCEWM